MEDITPKLLEAIQNDFQSQFDKSKTIQSLYAKIRDGTATYEGANEFAIKTGELLSASFQKNLSEEVLPDGRMYYNIANRILNTTLTNNYKLITDVTSKVQTSLNKAAGIGLKAVVPDVNEDRIKGLVNKVSSATEYSKVAWLLDEPVVNFSQSIVDDAIRANAEFHMNAGMRPKIIRKTAGNCCDWCSALSGSYTYPDVPDDVYRRHQRCRCTVEYYPRDGKVQNVHTKKWRNETNSDKIELRKSVGIEDFYDTSKHKHNPDGTIVVSRRVERKLPQDVKPLEVIDVVSVKGDVARTFFDEKGRRRMRIDNCDHGFPTKHPMGAHKHIIVYDEDGNYVRDSKAITLKKNDRKENADIL